jgi:hypothetical protein
MIDRPSCLCLHTLDQHADALFCLAPGCTCLNYEADPCGLPPTRHSQHITFEPSCDRCQDLLTEAREIASEPWEDV